MVSRISRLMLTASICTAISGQSVVSTAKASTGDAPALAEPSNAQLEQRLLNISYRLAKANAYRCSQPDMMTGAALHDIASYDANSRTQVAGAQGVGKGFSVRRLVAEGAAQRAGLQVGDEIIAIDGDDLTQFRLDLIGDKGSYDRVEALVRMWSSALRKGATQLTVRRNGELHALSLAADPGCGGEPVLMASRSFNAWSDGHYVAVTSRVMGFASSDDEIAFVVAHEMAHNLLHHDGYGETATQLFGNMLGSRKAGRSAELQADSFAVELMYAAEYDVAGATSFLTRSRAMRPFDLPLSHPGISRRIAAVDSALKTVEIQTASAGTRHTALAAAASIPPVAKAESVRVAWGTMPWAGNAPSMPLSLLVDSYPLSGRAILSVSSPSQAPTAATTGGKRANEDILAVLAGWRTPQPPMLSANSTIVKLQPFLADCTFCTRLALR